MQKSPEVIKKHYEDCFLKYGDNHKGADWPNLNDLNKRYKIMYSLIKNPNSDNIVLDFGCGTGMFYDIMCKQNFNIQYIGVDINTNLINIAKQKFEHKNAKFYSLDLLNNKDDFCFDYDYAICNGVFTEKLSLTQEQMYDFLLNTISILYKKAKHGIAFNVMSDIVDYKRDDLFHADFNTLLSFISKTLTRNFVIRNDYGLYEYTVYLYKGINI